MTHIHTRVHRSHVAGMHVMLFLLRKYQLCSNVVALGKLRVGLKISDKLCARIIPTCIFAVSQLSFYPRPSWRYLLIGWDHLMMNLCMFELYICWHAVLVCSFCSVFYDLSRHLLEGNFAFQSVEISPNNLSSSLQWRPSLSTFRLWFYFHILKKHHTASPNAQ